MIDTKFDPMPEVNSSMFKKEYINAVKNKTLDLNSFFNLIEPFKSTLISKFKKTDPDYYFIYFLLKNIESFGLNISHIESWAKEKTFESDIDFLICSRIRNIKTIPVNAKPVMSKYYFVTDFRLKVSNFLKKKYKNQTLNKQMFDFTHKKHYNMVYNPKIKNNYWQNYLKYLLIQGYTVTEISKITGYSRTTLYKEFKKYDYKEKSN